MGTETEKHWRGVDQERLKRLGFAQDVVSAVERMNQLGFFEVQPPDDLVERVIEKCIPLLPEPTSFVEPEPELIVCAPYLGVINQLAAAAHATSELGEFSESVGWQQACFTTLDYAQSTRERPFIFLDNHNVIEPSWWRCDTGFRAFWNAAQVVNRIVATDGIPRAACFVILRPALNDYSNDDIETMDEMIREGSSDVWWVPYNRAGDYRSRDLVVLGEERIIELKGRPASPVEALKQFEEIREQRLARGLRSEIRVLENLGISIRAEGRLTTEVAESIERGTGIRHLMESVIHGMCKAAR